MPLDTTTAERRSAAPTQETAQTSRHTVPAIFSATIFLSAFLLFLVQPMVARRILPWFGGATAVWTTCMLFFQALLLAGYYYSHHFSAVVRASLWHPLALGLSVLCLPALWLTTAPSAADPALGVLRTLVLTTGMPYLLLSTTGPLLQAWYARQFPGITPYRLFALSNLGSLLGLLAYPVLIEPWIGVELQMRLWAAFYAVFAALCATVAWQSKRYPPVNVEAKDLLALDRAVTTPPQAKLSWIVLPAASSALLLSVTNHLTQNIAPLPFLWVLPLVLYLASFIVCFDHRQWYQRKVFHPLAAAGLAAMAWALFHQNPENTLILSIPVYSLGLFLVCMFCHGELAARKPVASQLTSFYFLLSLGGALGALLVAVAAPMFLKSIVELPITIAACAVIALFLEYRKHWLTDILWAALAVGAVVAAAVQVKTLALENRQMVRNFYGALRVADRNGARLMIHGMVNHGMQRLDAKSMEPTAYFGRAGGAGQVLDQPKTMRVGVIGLGAGTLAVYSKPGDYYRYYELNPKVLDLARSEFTFLRDAKGKVDVVVGDGRLSLEREQAQGFDVFVVDAFSGDSIPVHLLTREAFQLYRRHLKPDGILALHISNSVIDLRPVVERLAAAIGRPAALMANQGDPANWLLPSNWAFVPMGNSPTPGIALPAQPNFPVWTDDYSNLLRILRW
ncbi:MAG: fused MFS/spermidine synthase [Bryobacterales bacterium]|nr:fused MFS/spermidine synthase [Bryobacterales bacterium]